MKLFFKIFSFTVVSAYLVTSFILWDLNPKMWPMEARGFVGVGTFVMSIFLAATAVPNNEQKVQVSDTRDVD